MHIRRAQKAVMFLGVSLVVFTGIAAAEKTIRGKVCDAETGAPLPYANIRVEGRFQGTITNPDGDYELRLEELPVDISVTYIGYHSARRHITEATPDTLTIALAQNPVVLEEIVVTPEDPAVGIMREVIRRKQEWRATLKNFVAEGYTRVALSNDERIVSISESISDVYWDVERGTRENIRSRRQTRNTQEEENFASARIVPNLYDDDIEIIGYDVIGPTNPRALEYYDFTLTGQRMQDGVAVFDIAMTPKTRLQPAFAGSLSVLDGVYAMISVSVEPNDVVMLPSPLNNFRMSVEQQFSNFGGDWWLPCDVRVGGEIKLKLPGLTFPTIKYYQLTRLTDYRLNTAVADSVFGTTRSSVTIGISNRGTTIDIETSEEKPGTAGSVAETQEKADSVAAVNADSMFAVSEMVVPMTVDEEAAYAEIDSTDTLGKAFRPTGFLTRMMDDEDENEAEEEPSNPSRFRKTLGRVVEPFSPLASYNRVDGVTGGLKFEKLLFEGITLTLTGSYREEPADWSYGGEARYRFGEGEQGFVSVSFDRGTEKQFQQSLYPGWLNSIGTVIGRDDYFNYFDNRAFSAGAGYRFGTGEIEIAGSVNAERHTSRVTMDKDGLFRREGTLRPNTAVEEGDLRSVALTVRQGTVASSYGITGGSGAELRIEYSSPDLFDSDFSFTRYEIELNRRFETFFRRRLFPNMLDIRVVAGIASDEAPPQRWGGIDGAFGVFAPFGTLRTLRDRPMTGRRYAALFGEHNFRTVPFELVHLDWLARRGIGLIVHGAVGTTEHERCREVGVSVNALFGLFRADLTRRLDRHGWFAGVGFARIY